MYLRALHVSMSLFIYLPSCSKCTLSVSLGFKPLLKCLNVYLRPLTRVSHWGLICTTRSLLCWVSPRMHLTRISFSSIASILGLPPYDLSNGLYPWTTSSLSRCLIVVTATSTSSLSRVGIVVTATSTSSHPCSRIEVGARSARWAPSVFASVAIRI